MTINASAAAARESARHSTGEFGEQKHTAPELTLTTVSWSDDLGGAGDWGQVNVSYGDRTPWGWAQHPSAEAEGIAFVPTDGHGGYKLSPERNAAIPAPYRNRSGWYEEDAERHIVEFYHYDALRWTGERNRDADLKSQDLSLRDWFPAAWEKVNGRALAYGESSQKDAQTWARMNADEYVVIGQKATDIEGQVLVTAERQSTGDRDEFLVSLTARDAARDAAREEPGSQWRFRLPEGAQLQPRPEPAALVPGVTVVPRTDGLTVAASAKLQKDLDRRWRLDDGRVLTLRQQIEQGIITGKSVSVSDAGVREYRLDDANTHSVMAVSKATWEAFGAPDERTEKDRAREDWDIARSKAEKAQRAVDRAWRPSTAQLAAARDANRKANAALDAYTALRGD